MAGISQTGRAVCGTLLAALLLAPSTLSAADSTTPSAAPWIGAAQLAHDAASDIKRNGVPSVKKRIQALETALDEGAKAFPPPPAADGTVTILVDGAAETKAVRAAAAQKPNVVVAENPYPCIDDYLATYYNNGGQPYDALRVVDIGLKLRADDQNLGEQLPNLYNEKGFSLEILKRWPDALQICTAGLDLPAADRLDRGQMYRCMGYSLSELGRFDEAATAYRAAIRADPNDRAAPIELEFALRNRDKKPVPPPP